MNPLEGLAAALAGEALAAAMRSVQLTSRLRLSGQAAVAEAAARGRPILLVCWHGDDLVCLSSFPRVHPAARGAVIVRDDPRGRALQRFVRRFSVKPVRLGRDPRSSQWARAVVRFSELIADGAYGMLAVDGPEGPAHRVKPGAAMIADRTGALLVPTAVAADRALRLDRWDRHLVPLPGSRLAIFTGAPLEPATDAAGRLDPPASAERIARGLEQAAEGAAALLRS